jgi:hypothetical protein
MRTNRSPGLKTTRSRMANLLMALYDSGRTMFTTAEAAQSLCIGISTMPGYHFHACAPPSTDQLGDELAANNRPRGDCPETE